MHPIFQEDDYAIYVMDHHLMIHVNPLLCKEMSNVTNMQGTSVFLMILNALICFLPTGNTKRFSSTYSAVSDLQIPIN